MPHSVLGMQHFHKRIRIHQKHEPYPHPNKWKRFMDRAIYVVGILGPIMTMPQLIKIWAEKNAIGVSATTWIAYLLVAIFWLIYGTIHREKLIMTASILWIIVDILVVIGIIIYG